jgi:Domain of unknown function (DUF5011)/Bacterial Ig-like domain (group 3)
VRKGGYMKILKYFMLCFILYFAFAFSNQIQAKANTEGSCNPDLVAPVISNTKDFILEQDQEEPDYLEGIEFTDNCGTVHYYVESRFVDLTTVGVYPLYYFASDNSGNSTSITVFVHVKYDITLPLLSGLEDKRFPAHTDLNDALFLEGVTANDNREGDITHMIQVDYTQVDTTKVGIYDVIYTVTDAHLNTRTETTQVEIYDEEAPIISIESPVFEVFNQEPDWFDYITVTDNLDTAPTITITHNDVNLNQIGTYTITYQAVDAEGNESTATMTVEVKDTTSPIVVVSDQAYEVFSEAPDWLSLIQISDNYDPNLIVEIDTSLVNFNVLGDYVVTVTATDQSQNTTTVSFTVTIEDTTGPRIEGHIPNQEVLSDEPDWLSFITVTDLYDQNPTIEITEFNVNLNMLGTYTITFKATDAEGNETFKTLTVIVEDTTKPTIQLPDSTPTIEVFDTLPDLLSYLTITDNFDSNPFIEIEHTIDRNTIGLYDVTITVTDGSGNTDTKIYQIQVVDTVKPEIILTHQFKHLIGDETPDYLQFIEITDNYDGIISVEKLTIHDSFVNLNQEGLYPITFEVMDSSGNYNYLSTKIEVYDETAPVISGMKDLIIPLNFTTINYLDGVTASDNILNDITNEIIVNDSHVQYSEAGSYFLNYIVIDLSNNVTIKTITVTVVEDTDAPTLSNTKDITIDVSDPEPNYLEGVVATDNLDEILFIHVDKTAVQLDVLGSYDIIYTTTDRSGNTTVMTQQVHVVDRVNPTLSGTKDTKVEVGGTVPNYLLGVTAADNYDTELEIVVDQSLVKYDTLGAYQITYTVTDSSGNATTAKQNVTIVDTTKPVLSGVKDMTITKGKTFDPKTGIRATDNYDPSVEITTSGDYNPKKVGTYTITVKASDASGNIATEAYQLTVEQNYTYFIWGASIAGAMILSGSIFFVVKKKKKQLQ